MDLRSVVYRHEDRRTHLKLGFHDPLPVGNWTSSQYVIFQMWTRGNDNDVDFFVEFAYLADPGGYYCDVRDDISDLVKRVPITKGSRSVKCDFRTKFVRGVAEGFVADAYDNGGMDFAPNEGRYHH